MNSNMICNSKSSERLYLSKGDQDIYIDNCNISQHHIDGIRFIYRLYKKNKPGCIISYRPGDSRNLQVVLFLKAILHILKKPVLVLCNEKHPWMEHFQTWTNFYDGKQLMPKNLQIEIVMKERTTNFSSLGQKKDDLTVITKQTDSRKRGKQILGYYLSDVEVTEKPLFKKSIQINTMCNLAQFSRNEWSVLIVDDDQFIHQVLKLPFKADYKIFITPDNMNKDLDKFSQIYAWLHPEEAKQKNMWKFDKNEFIPDKNNLADVLDKTIRLDAFMEDIVSYNYVSDVRIEQRHTNRRIAENNPPMTVSKKNKDATGTKIKRSKRKIYDDDNIIPSSKTKTDETNLSGSNKVQNNEHNENIPHKKDSQILDIGIDKMNSQCLSLYFEPDTGTDVNSDKYYEMDTLVFSNDILCEDKSQNLNEPVKASNDLERYISMDNSLNSDKIVTNELDMQAENENVTISLSKDSPSIDNMQYTVDSKLNRSLENSPTFSDELKLDNNDMKISRKSSDINEVCPENEMHIDKAFKCGEGTLDITNGININGILNEAQKELRQDRLLGDIILVESKIAAEKSKQDIILEDIKSVASKTEAPVTNILKRNNSIEEKIKVMEENAIKKFKGSILDSLF